nr:hypothetical protein [Tanacetum cinerariifolium]
MPPTYSFLMFSGLLASSVWAFEICLGRSKPMVITKARTLNGGWKRIQLKRDKSEQNRIKTGQKWEAWKIPEESRAVSVDRARKTEENAKRMVKNANTVEKLLKF